MALVTFLALPGFLANIGLSGSHAAGILFSTLPLTLIVLGTGGWMPFRKNEFYVCVCIFFIILIHFLLVASVGLFDNYNSVAISRFILSLLLLLVLLWSAFQFVKYFSTLKQVKFMRMINTIYWVFLVIAVLSIPFHIFDWVSRKQMLIFSEPSHFAITFGPFFVFQMLTSKHRYKHLLLCFTLAVFL